MIILFTVSPASVGICGGFTQHCYTFIPVLQVNLTTCYDEKNHLKYGPAKLQIQIMHHVKGGGQIHNVKKTFLKNLASLHTFYSTILLYTFQINSS